MIFARWKTEGVSTASKRVMTNTAGLKIGVKRAIEGEIAAVLQRAQNQQYVNRVVLCPILIALAQPLILTFSAGAADPP